MDVKQTLIFEVKKNDFNFQFIVEQGATWGSALDAAYEILEQVGKMSQENAAKLKPVEQNED